MFAAGLFRSRRQTHNGEMKCVTIQDTSDTGTTKGLLRHSGLATLRATISGGVADGAG